MNDRQKKQGEEYLRFMGQWMAGAVVGRFIGKVLCWILSGWIICKIFETF